MSDDRTRTLRIWAMEKALAQDGDGFFQLANLIEEHVTGVRNEDRRAEAQERDRQYLLGLAFVGGARQAASRELQEALRRLEEEAKG